VSLLALISQKGGVGKTTIAVNLSYSLARRGWRIVLVDADSQGGVGFSLTEKSKNAPGVFDLLAEGREFGPEEVRAKMLDTNLPGLRLLTRGSRDAMGHIVSDPAGDWASAGRLSLLVRSLAETECDLVIFDTPSGMHPVTIGIAGEVDALLVPEQPAPLSLRSLPQLLRMVATVRSRYPEAEGPSLAGFVLSMTSPEDPSSLQDQREFRDLLPLDMVLEAVIPRHRDLLEASRVGVPVAMLSEKPSASSLIFDQLAAELEPRLDLNEANESLIDERQEYARLVD